MPQDEILSEHWDHAFCTSFTAIVHFKDSKDKFLKKKRFIIVSNYMNHDKYVVLKFLNIISDEFSKSQPDLIISKRFLHSDGTAQHFKQKYSLCSMTLMDGNIEWDFSATSHGKRDIDGLGSVVLVSRESMWTNPCLQHWSTKLYWLCWICFCCLRINHHSSLLENRCWKN